jgi:glycosyltransferase involved in cell wall biosynthesis
MRCGNLSFSNPLVSIVIPVYNGSNFLRDAIESALAQTYRSFEVLVVNDGSDDGGKTAQLARSYGDRIRYFEQPNRGVSAALNKGIQEMKGGYFAWLSHDDVFLPRKLELQVRALETEGADVVVYSDYELVDAKLRRIKKKIMGDVAPEQFRFRILLDTALHGCTILIPRVCFEKGGFDEALRTTQDYEMWFRLAETYRFVRVPGDPCFRTGFTLARKVGRTSGSCPKRMSSTGDSLTR